ncbi:Vps62-related protein [Microdochium nivale]|nr:Vps62-related protein [Microdochium nivale]
MRRAARRALVATPLTLGALLLLLWLLPQALNPVKPSRERREADRRWVDTSPCWLDRQACRWLGLCGLAHIRDDPPEGRKGAGQSDNHGGAVWGAYVDQVELRRREGSGGTARRRRRSTAAASEGVKTTKDRQRNGTAELRGIPQYVLDHAPLVHLYSGEHFWPSDIAEHLEHMVPRGPSRRGRGRVNLTEPLALDSLSEELNPLLHGGGVFLSSEVDVEDRPAWLHSHDSVPLPFPHDDDDEDQQVYGQMFDGEDEDDDDSSGVSLRYPAGGTTWFDVDKGHPLHLISDPRRKPAGQPGSRGQFLTAGDDQNSRVSRGKRSRAFRSERSSSSTTSARAAEGAQSNDDDNDNNNNHHHHRPTHSSSSDGVSPGYSRAPATLILVDKGSGVVDAFWFFFYAYNLGQSVLGVRFGNHVGDWEHAMVRFESGVPRAVYLSEHEGGQAYAWAAVEKKKQQQQQQQQQSERPVIYSAVGSHAMYAAPGDHPYVLPFNMLRDVTDRGPLWDPAGNMRSYWYDYTAADDEDSDHGDDGGNGNGSAADRGLSPTAENPDAPTSWFHYAGVWGDDFFALSDERQYRLFGQYHYVAGPQGPKAKNLGRSRMCQAAGDRPCRMIHSIEEGRRRSWYS